MNETKLNPFRIFSLEISLGILSYLEPQDLGQCLQVSKEWRKLAGHDYLWKPLLILCEKEKIPIINGKVWTLIVTSPQTLRAKIESFRKKIPSNQLSFFNCHFLDESRHYLFDQSLKPTSPETKIEVILNCVKKNREHTNVTQEHCIFVHTNKEKNKIEYQSSNKSIDWRRGDSSNTFGGLFTYNPGTNTFSFDDSYEDYRLTTTVGNHNFSLSNSFVREIQNNILARIIELERQEKIKSIRDFYILNAVGVAVGFLFDEDRTLGQLAAFVSTFFLTRNLK